MATGYKTYKDSSDAQRDITRLKGILARQQQFLKSRKSSDPEYVEAKNAIKETLASIKKAEEIFKKFDAVEKQTKKEETLTTAQENLTYAQESGNPVEVVSAQNAVDKARKDVNAVKEAEAAAAAKAKTDRDKKVTSNAGYIGYKGPAVTPIKTEGPFTKDGAKKDSSLETTDKSVVPAPRTSTGPQRTGGEMGGPGFDPDAVSSAQKYAKAIAKAYELYQMPDIIFKNVDSLGKLLQRYLDNKLTLEQFQQEVGNDIWFRKNSVEIKNRWVQKFNYDDLVTSGQAQGTTNYEQSIAKIARDVQVRARAIGAVVDDTQAKQIAQDLYIYNQEADDIYVTNRLSGFIRSQSGMIGGNVTEGYSGQALQNYQALQASAKANGFKLEDILPKNAQGAPQTAQQVLQGLATGTIDSTRLQQDVRKLAAQGQPQYVRDLLGQGYDLETIYAPYKQRLASVLELNPDQVQLNDPSLRQAITDKGDMNLYDFERALRKDGRWQYTTDAKKTVADSAMSVLRDFGFQG